MRNLRAGFRFRVRKKHKLGKSFVHLKDSHYFWENLQFNKIYMKISVEKGKETVISLSGQLDTLTSAEFEKVVAEILKENPEKVVLNGAELTYISSAGLRLLLTLQKGMKSRNGCFHLKNIRPEIMEIFNLTGFSSILTIL